MCRLPTADCRISSGVKSPSKTASCCKRPRASRRASIWMCASRPRSFALIACPAHPGARVGNRSRIRQIYDALILSTGASPLKPPIPGIEHPNHFVVRNIPDVERIMAWSNDCQRCRAVVVGGGYIGLEMAEQLRHRGFDVTVAQGTAPGDDALRPRNGGVAARGTAGQWRGPALNDRVVAFEPPSEQEPARASIVVLKSGQRLPADSVILGLGVKPETSLATDAGLEIGKRGGIRVNEHLQTSDPHIWAVGDAIEVRDGVTGQWALIALAGPANRRGALPPTIFSGVRPDTNTPGARPSCACSSSPPAARARIKNPSGVPAFLSRRSISIPAPTPATTPAPNPSR